MAVQFQDQQHTRVIKKRSGLSGYIIKLGLAKDERSAQMVLLIIAVLAILIGGFFALSGGEQPSAQEGAPLPPGQIPE